MVLCCLSVCWLGFCWLFDGWLLIVFVGYWLFVGNGCLLVVVFLVIGGLLVFDCLFVVCW